MAWGQAPAYSAAGIVNASNYTAGPFAPNSVLSLFGSNLAYTTQALTAEMISGNKLPTTLAATIVLVENSPAPLLYVSPTQINFLIPSDQIPGDITVQVVRQSVRGPKVTITLVDVAPALFISPDGDPFLLAQDWTLDNAVITVANPAHSGNFVVIYATGLGHTRPNPSPGEIPQTAAYLATADFTVVVNGAPLDPFFVRYAGVTPGCAGLYQVNLMLPGWIGFDPEIQLAVGSQTTPPGIKLVVR